MDDQLSFKDFLKELSKLSTQLTVNPDDNISFAKIKNAKEIYEELCLDFPLVTVNEIRILNEEILNKIAGKNTKFGTFPIIRRSFLEGISYGARKSQNDVISKVESPNMKQDEPKREEPLRIFDKQVEIVLEIAVDIRWKKCRDCIRDSIALLQLKQSN
jgi:hypothetical protein